MSASVSTGPHTADAVHDQLRQLGIIPVLTIERVEDAAPLARALAAGGLRAVEVTLRTPAALRALEVMATEGGLLVGAGTVLNAEQVSTAVDSGARFVVSPGWSEAVLLSCRERGVPFLPGTATASEVQRALEHGVDVVKFFPAEAMGGLRTIQALAAPFSTVRFVPTGGISEQTASAYLGCRSVLAVGGSWMVPADLIRAGDWAAITRLSEAAVAVVARARADR